MTARSFFGKRQLCLKDSHHLSELRTDPMSPQLPNQRPDRPEKASAAAGAAMRAALEKTLEDSSRGPLVRPSIPDHVLLQRIGTGAYGDVWMGRSTLGSLRAIKVVYRDRFEEERPFQREYHGILRQPQEAAPDFALIPSSGLTKCETSPV